MANNIDKRSDVLNSEVKDGYTEPDSIRFNPFPGLRPFSPNESHLFFGREKQVDEILAKLSKNRSVAILGSSGSGKSSLVYCGVVPVLYGGFMTETGPNWLVIQSRPGVSPIENLANSIVASMASRGALEKDDEKIQREVVMSILRSSPFGLIEVSKFLQKRGNENVCFLLDQFEEIFRYSAGSGDISRNESHLYVSLVLTALAQKDAPVFVAISMRSDFINECSEYPGLSEILNQSNYVVPKMTREQKRIAIEGPVAVGGGKISNRLTKRLLSDLEDAQDALPILQHALMRTWDYWVLNHEPEEPIDIRHYNAVGRIDQALSQHANEAFDELTSREKEIAEIIFKNITEKNQDNQGMRRPGRISEIAELSGASDVEVIKVVDQFRKTGRSFLMPGIQVPLGSDSIVEISHESLMRIWIKLAGWVDDEFESSQMYKRLSEASAMYQIGRTGLWRPPDLQLALNWQKKQNPTRTWAQRYDIAFERSIVFLDTSRITYEAELKNQEMLQKRLLRRARITNIILGLAFLIAMGVFFWGLTQKLASDKKADEAKVAADKAEIARVEAITQTEKAEQALLLVKEKEKELEKNNIDLTKAFLETEVAIARAERNLIVAKEQERIAKDAQRLEAEQRIKAEEAQKEALASSEQKNALLMLTIAQSMEAKAETMDDAQMSGLLAMQGYNFHTRYGGKQYDPYVFRGLYYAAIKLKGNNYNALVVPGDLKNRMYALAVSSLNNGFYVSGSDGRIFSGDMVNNNVGNRIGENDFPNRALALSPDEKYLAVTTDSSAVQVFSLPGGGKPLFITGHKDFVNDVKFMPDNSGFISASVDKTIRFNDPKTGKSKLLLTFPFDIKAISINGAGTFLVGVSTSGKLALVDLRNNSFTILKDESPNRILSVAFHPTQNRIAYGLEIIGSDGKVQKGTLKLLDINSNRGKDLSGHKAGVSAVEFSPDGQLIASASLDKRLQMWVVDHEEDLPVVMDNNNGNIWNIGFAKGSDYLLATCNNGEIRIWPTNPKMLADLLCPKITRSMTAEEWDIYVGAEIAKEETCEK